MNPSAPGAARAAAADLGGAGGNGKARFRTGCRLAGGAEKLVCSTAPAAVRQTHFPAGEQDLEKLCAFRTPAQVRLIFEEFFSVGAGWR